MTESKLCNWCDDPATHGTYYDLACDEHWKAYCGFKVGDYVYVIPAQVAGWINHWQPGGRCVVQVGPHYSLVADVDELEVAAATDLCSGLSRMRKQCAL